MKSRFARAGLIALVAGWLGACGSNKQARPTEVEIQWPDAGAFVPQTTPSPPQLDAGRGAPDAMPQ